MGLFDWIKGLITPYKPPPFEAYANTWPEWERQSPQYTTPSAYSLAQLYRSNEVVFACIEQRFNSVAEARLTVYQDTGDGKREELPDHPVALLLKKPNSKMTQMEFVQALMVYLDVAGSSNWEIEYNRGGDPISLWPMRPDWCAYIRGEGNPLAFVRYQPYGLPPKDLSTDDIVVVQQFDPLYPMLKGLSRTAVAMRIIGVDMSTTTILDRFMQSGGFLQGLLSTDQHLSAQEADRIQSEWLHKYGGSDNAGKIGVVGSGVKYQQMSQSFRDMAFPDVDARTESRICMAYRVSPILINAKIGMDRSTYSNYAEANKAFHQFTIAPLWRFIASQMTEQLLPKFTDDPTICIDWDLSQVRALQEDKDKAWARSTIAFQNNLIARDEARQEMGLDPIDNDLIFASDLSAAAPVDDLAQEEPDEGEQETLDQEQAVEKQDDLDGTQDEQDAEEQKFRAFAKRRQKEGKPEQVKSFQWRHTPGWKQAVLMLEVGAAQDAPFQEGEN